MKYLTLSIILIFPLLAYTQVEVSYEHCDCVDNIEAIEPALSGIYERTCSGELIEKGQFKDGKKVGLWESFSLTGKKIREFNYDDNGLLHGKMSLFYADGTKKLEGEFEENKRVGNWGYYNNRGKLQKEGAFEDGKPVGTWKIYNAKGKKEAIVYDFAEGEYVQNSPELKYFENEEIIKNDNKGEWFILFYPDVEGSEAFRSVEHLRLAMDMHIKHLEIPLEFWDTYASYLYQSTLVFED
ncbi:MAG: hypothetical protein AAF391_01825 [Bacteroidota bacterium]